MQSEFIVQHICCFLPMELISGINNFWMSNISVVDLKRFVFTKQKWE